MSIASISVAATSAAAGRRLVVAVGVNEGSPSQEPLRFAESDARAVLGVMRDLGDVSSSDAIALVGVTAGELRRELARIDARLRREGFGEGDQVFVYVSSHAAAGALHLRGTRFPLLELRAFVEAVPASVAVLVLDTCQAGWLEREKGLTPITGRRVVVEEPTVEGRAFIASSGPSESSHESDRISGSYFTHHLLAGMRGAADFSADGRVTLQEAFSYAYSRTVEATVGAVGGRQTPQYEFDLAGHRELVLTELERARGLLTLQVDAPGEWGVSPQTGDGLAMRFSKRSGPVSFAVAPGAYLVRAADEEHIREMRLEVGEGDERFVTEADLSQWPRLRRTPKGFTARWTLAAGARLGTPAVDGMPAALGGLALVVSRDDPQGLLGFGTWYELDLGARSSEANRPEGMVHTEADMAVGLGVRRFLLGAEVRGGLQAGGLLIVQTHAPGGDRVGVQPRIGAILGLRTSLTRRVFFDARVAGGGQFIDADSDAGLSAYALGTLLLGFAL